MAGQSLIDDQLAQLRSQLPEAAVEELADGLLATYEHHLASGLDPAAAAAAAIDEFGHPGEIVAAFVRQSPGRRTALALLITGPLFAACWGPSLYLMRAWAWPIPRVATVAFMLLLAAVAMTLLMAATSQGSYARARVAVVGATGLLLLDTAALAAIVFAAPTLIWLMAFASTASLTRITLTTRALILWHAGE
jgi:hypothetical protein